MSDQSEDAIEAYRPLTPHDGGVFNPADSPLIDPLSLAQRLNIPKRLMDETLEASYSNYRPRT